MEIKQTDLLSLRKQALANGHIRDWSPISPHPGIKAPPVDQGGATLTVRTASPQGYQIIAIGVKVPTSREPLMGSLVVTRPLFLSFTSYNPDISSDYRQRSFYFRGNASLLGCNQIILYSSIFSVYYYPAPGPSFFYTDIQNFNKPVNKTFLPDKLRRLGYVLMDMTPIRLLLSPISVCLISIAPILYERLNQIINPPKTAPSAIDSKSRQENTYKICETAKYNTYTRRHTEYKITKTTVNVSPLPGIHIRNLDNPGATNRRLWKSESRPCMPSRKATKSKGTETKINASTINSNIKMSLIKIIMVISTRVKSDVKFRYIQQHNYTRTKGRSWQSKPFKGSGKASPASKETKNHKVAEEEIEKWEGASQSLKSIMTVIMVISTRAAFAVKTSPKFRSRFAQHKCKSRKVRLHKPRNEASNDPNETGRWKRSNNKRNTEPQICPIILLITLIMVISTRADSAVKLCIIIHKMILRNPKLDSHNVRLPSNTSKTQTHLIEPGYIDRKIERMVNLKPSTTLR